jgi:hypothetical protein
MFATICTISPYIFALPLDKISLSNAKPCSLVNSYHLRTQLS